MLTNHLNIIDRVIVDNYNNLNPDYAIGKFQSKQTYYKI